MAARRWWPDSQLMFHFTNSSPVIHGKGRAARIRAVNVEL